MTESGVTLPHNPHVRLFGRVMDGQYAARCRLPAACRVTALLYSPMLEWNVLRGISQSTALVGVTPGGGLACTLLLLLLRMTGWPLILPFAWPFVNADEGAAGASACSGWFGSSSTWARMMGSVLVVVCGERDGRRALRRRGPSLSELE